MIRAFALALALSAAANVTAASAATANEIKPLKLATGELLVHAFKDGMPLPSESKWMLCSGAGPSFFPEGGGYRLNWVVHLKDKGALAKAREIVRVRVQEVSGAVAVPLYDGPPQAAESGLMIIAPENIVSRENYPWLYTPESTLVVLRVTLHTADGEQDKLLQPVLIGNVGKRNLRAQGIGG